MSAVVSPKERISFSTAKEFATSLLKAIVIPRWKQRSNHIDSLSAFERLPPEIILLIRDALETPALVLLSLTCKRLYYITAKKLDPTLYTTKDRIDISRCLEVDRPKYLTCRLCGLLFHWQRRARFSYSCPAGHDKAGVRVIRPKIVAVKAYPSILINLETIDLISRYYERGSKAGVSAAWLNQSGSHRACIPQETKARWVRGQLVVHTQWTLEPDVIRKTNGSVWQSIHTCYHDDAYMYRWRRLSASAEHIDTIYRCSYCACDVEVSQQVLANGSSRFTVKSWCNYGNTRAEDLSIQQNLRTANLVRIDQGTLSQRNIRELFDSGEDETNDEEIKKVRKQLEEDELFYPRLVCAPQ